MTKVSIPVQKSRRRAARLSFIAAALTPLLFSTPSAAQSCPADLSALDAQIQTPGLRARLTLPLDPIIQNAGSVAEALIRTRTALEEAQARRTQAVANGGSLQVLDEAILILTRQIEALECRQGAG